MLKELSISELTRMSTDRLIRPLSPVEIQHLDNNIYRFVSTGNAKIFKCEDKEFKLSFDHSANMFCIEHNNISIYIDHELAIFILNCF